MSGKISGTVWDLDLPQQEKYILLAFADHADHDGKHVKPGLELICWKTGYKRRYVQKIMEILREKGILLPVKHTKGGRGHYPEYKIVFPPQFLRRRHVKDAQEDTLSEKSAPQNTLYAKDASEDILYEEKGAVLDILLAEKDALEDALLCAKDAQEDTLAEKRVHCSAQKGAFAYIEYPHAEPSGTKEKTEPLSIIPPLPEHVPKKSSRKSKDAETSFPEDFSLTLDMRSWFVKQGFCFDVEAATEEWADAMQKNTNKYRYTNWVAAWKSGMRNKAKWEAEKPKTGVQPRSQHPQLVH